MSVSTENRIVGIEFDNSKFENNVQDTISSLKNLDKTLENFGNTSKDGFSELGKSAEASASKIDNIKKSINETKKSIFSFTEQFKIGFAFQFGSDLAKTLENAFSGILNTYKEAWSKMDDINNSTRTIMYATGNSIEYTESQLQRLSWFADETSYSLQDMTGNIAKFTAQNVSLEDSITAMEGIALATAKAGQNTEAASRAMYNLSQSIGMGYLTLADWKSLELANVATKELKQTFLDTAVELGKLKKISDGVYETVDEETGKAVEVTVQNFRESLKNKWATDEVIIATYAKYGEFGDELSKVIGRFGDAVGITATQALGFIKDLANGVSSIEVEEAVWNLFPDAAEEDINALMVELANLSAAEYDFSRAAFEAGQQATSFSQAIAATKDAASSAWSNIYKSIFGNVEEATKFWTSVSEQLYNIFVEPINALGSFIDKIFGSKWSDITAEVTAAGYSVDDFKTSVVEVGNAMSDTFVDKVKKAGGLTAAIDKGKVNLRDFEDVIIKIGSESDKNFEKMIKDAGGVEKAYRDGKISLSDYAAAIMDAGAKMTGDFDKQIEKAGGFNQAMEQGLITVEMLEQALNNLETGNYTTELEEGTYKAIQSTEELKDLLDAIWRGDYGNGTARINALDALGYNGKEIQNILDEYPETYQNNLEAAMEYYNGLENVSKKASGTAGETLDAARDVLAGTADAYKSGATLFKETITNFLEGFGILVGYVNDALFGSEGIFSGNTEGRIRDFLVTMNDISAKFLAFVSDSETLKETIKTIGSVINTVLNIITGSIKIVIKAIGLVSGPIQFVIGSFWKLLGVISSAIDVINSEFGKTGDLFNDIATWIGKLSDIVGNFFRNIIPNINLDAIKSKLEHIVSVVKDFIQNGINAIRSINIGKYLDKISNFFTVLKEIGYKTIVKITESLKENYRFLKELYDRYLKDKVIFSLETIFKKIVEIRNTIKGLNFQEIMTNFFTSSKTKFIDFVSSVQSAISNFDPKVIIDSIKDAISYAKNYIKELITKIKMSDVISSIVQGFKTAITGGKSLFRTIWDAVKQFVSDLWEHILDIDLEFYFSKAIKLLWEGIKNVFSFIGEGISAFTSPFIRRVKEFFGESIPNSITSTRKNISDALKDFVEWFKSKLPNMTEVFSGIGSDISAFFERIKLTFQGIWNWLKASWAAIKDFLAPVYDFFAPFFAPIVDLVSKFCNDIKTAADNGTLIEDLNELVNIFLKFSVAFSNIKAAKGFSKVTKSFKEVTKSVTTSLGNIGTAGTEFIKSLSTSTSDGIAGAFKSFASVFNNIGGIFSSVSDLVNSYGKINKSYAFLNIAKSLLMISAALAICVGGIFAIYLLYQKDKEAINNASIIIGSILAEIAGILIVMTIMASKMANKPAVMIGSILAIASVLAGFYLLAMAMLKFSSLSEEEIEKSYSIINELTTKIGVFIAALMFLAMLCNRWSPGVGTSILGIAASFLSISVAMFIISYAIEKVRENIENLNQYQLNRISTVFLAMMVMMTIMAAAAGLSGVTWSTGVGMALMAAVFVIMAEAMIKMIKAVSATNLLGEKKVTTEDLDKFQKLFGSIIGLGLVMAAIVGVAGWSDFSLTQGTALLAMAFAIKMVVDAMLTITEALQKAKKENGNADDVIGSFIMVLILLIGLVVALSYLGNKVKADSLSALPKAAIGLAASVWILSIALNSLSKINWSWGMIPAILLIGFVLTAIAYIGKNADGNAVLGTAAAVVALGLFISIMADVFKKYDDVPIMDEVKALAPFAVLAAIFGGITYALGKVNYMTMLKSLSIMLAIEVLLIGLAHIGKQFASAAASFDQVSDAAVGKMVYAIEQIGLVFGSLMAILGIAAATGPQGFAAVLAAGASIGVVLLTIDLMVKELSTLAFAISNLMNSLSRTDDINWDTLIDGLKRLYSVIRNNSYSDDGGLVSSDYVKNLSTLADGLLKLLQVVKDPAFAAITNTETWTKVQTSLSTLFEGFSNAKFSTLVSTMESSAAVSALENLSNVLSNIVSKSTEITGTTDAVTAMFNAFQSGQTINWDGIKTGIGNLWTEISEKDILGGIIGQVNGKNLSGFTELINNLKTFSEIAVTDGFATMVGTDYTKMSTGLTDIFNAFKGTGSFSIGEIVTTLQASKIVGELSKLGAGLTDLHTGLANSEDSMRLLTDMIGTFQTAGKIPWYSMTNGILTLFTQTEGKKFDSFTDKNVEAFKTFVESAEKLSVFVESGSFDSFMNTEYGSITDKLNALIGDGDVSDEAAQNVGSMADKISALLLSDGFSNLEGVSSKLSDSVSNITSSFGDLGNIEGYLSSLSGGLGSSIGEWTTTSTDFMNLFGGTNGIDTSSFDQVIASLENAGGTDGVLSIMGGSLDSFGEGVTACRTSFTDLETELTNLQTNLDGRQEEFKQIGIHLTEGLANGIGDTAAIQKVKDAAVAVIVAAKQAAMKESEEKSPSKLFARIGGYLTEGLAIGMGDNISMVEDESKTVIDAIRDAMYGTETLANGILNDEGDFVIRPVLDLSDVMSGANTINSMFGSRTMAIAGNVSATNARIQNGSAQVPAQNVVTLDANSLAALNRSAGGNQAVDVHVSYEGSLAYLASVLQPAITAESKRVGVNLVKG